MSRLLQLCCLTLALALLVNCTADIEGEWSSERLSAFAACLTDEGWIMYASITCSACRAQRKAFGPAFEKITEVECNPHAQNTQVDRCIDRKITQTPTWIQELDGKALQRVDGYRLLDDLAIATGCEL